MGEKMVKEKKKSWKQLRRKEKKSGNKGKIRDREKKLGWKCDRGKTEGTRRKICRAKLPRRSVTLQRKGSGMAKCPGESGRLKRKCRRGKIIWKLRAKFCKEWRSKKSLTGRVENGSGKNISRFQRGISKLQGTVGKGGVLQTQATAKVHVCAHTSSKG